MTVPQWPFSRARPSGYADDDVPSPAELTQIDEQLSRAANGVLWSDVALVKNFAAPIVAAHGTKVLIWEPVAKIWLALGVTAGPHPSGYISFDRGKTWPGGLHANYYASSFTPVCAATDGLGNVVVGLNPNASSASKITHTSDHFSTGAGTLATLGGVNTNSVYSIIYSARLALWIAGLSDGSIWTSPDMNTWTSRKAADGRAKTSFAEGPDRIVAVDNPGDRTHMSLDGITWTTSSSFAGFSAGPAICFVSQPAPGAFLMMKAAGAGTGVTARSTDGLNWSFDTTGSSFFSVCEVDPSAGFYGPVIVSYGRMVAVAATGVSHADIYYSLDVGLTWKASGAVYNGTTAVNGLAFGDSQFIARDIDGSDNAGLYAGISGGL